MMKPGVIWIFSLGITGLQACAKSKFQQQPPPVSTQPAVQPAPTVAANPAIPVEPAPTPPPPPPPTPPPAGAVVKGSFTVFAEPRFPKEGEDYKIIVRVTLPTGAGTNYKYEDLSIQVTGSDEYTSSFPQGNPSDVSVFSVKGDMAVATMLIPGAALNVKDTINVSSKLLNEKQQIELVFGADPAQK